MNQVDDILTCKELTKSTRNFTFKKEMICPTCNKNHNFIKNIKKEQWIPFVPDKINCNSCEKEEDKLLELDEQNKQQEIIKKKQQDIFKNAKLPLRYFKNNFDNIDKNENVEKAIKYVNNFNINSDECISLTGWCSTGKTVILDCICKYLLKKGYTVLFIDFSRLLDRLNATYNKNSNETEDEIINWLLSFDFIAFDDLGREKCTEKRLELSFKIFNGLYNNMKNYGFSANYEMIEKLKQIPEFKAIFERFKQSCKYNLEFTGEGLR